MRKLLLLFAILAITVSMGTLFNRSVLAEGDEAPTTSNGSTNIVVQTIPGPTVAQKYATRTKTSWSWYIVRGSGLVAAASLIILMLSGIGLVTGYSFRFLEPLTAWASHRALGLTFAIAVLVHIFGLLFDHFVSFNLLQLLVPWLSNYRPVTIAGVHLGSLYVALGVLAFYAIAIAMITITSLVWIDKKPYTWKLFHLLSYLVMLFVFVHALYGVAVAIVHRLKRAKTV
jgi:predicted ferric reductase